MESRMWPFKVRQNGSTQGRQPLKLSYLEHVHAHVGAHTILLLIYRVCIYMYMLYVYTCHLNCVVGWDVVTWLLSRSDSIPGLHPGTLLWNRLTTHTGWPSDIATLRIAGLSQDPLKIHLLYTRSRTSGTCQTTQNGMSWIDNWCCV